MNLNQEQKYAVDITEVIMQMFDEESENYKNYDLEKMNLTSFMTGFIISFGLLHSKFTGEDGDLLDSIAVMNRLVFQYGKTEENKNVE